jgi:hypothetical protein
MSASLHEITKSMNDEDFNITRENIDKSLNKFIKNDKIIVPEIKQKVKSLDELRSVVSDKLLYYKRQKGVFPYDYIKSFDVFKEKQLPPKEAFYSITRDEDVSDEDYQYAKDMFNLFRCKNLGEYSDLYLDIDVDITCDAIEKFRMPYLEVFELDPLHVYSTSGVTWNCGLKYTNIKLELFTDVNMKMMTKKGMRGGFSGVLGNRYAKANNKYLLDYDPSKPSSYLIDFDENNLYGTGMSAPLPYKNFPWIEDQDELWSVVNKLKYNPKRSLVGRDGRSHNKKRIGYIFEVDLEYTDECKLKTIDLQLAFNRKSHDEILLSKWQRNELQRSNTNSKKLYADLYNKYNYTVHYRLLKFYIYMGMKVTKIHRGFSFNEKPWLKPYINYNTNQRKKATTEFEKNLYKNNNNCFFGKSIEDIESHRKIDLITNEKKLMKVQGSPFYCIKDKQYSYKIN